MKRCMQMFQYNLCCDVRVIAIRTYNSKQQKHDITIVKNRYNEPKTVKSGRNGVEKQTPEIRCTTSIVAIHILPSPQIKIKIHVVENIFGQLKNSIGLFSENIFGRSYFLQLDENSTDCFQATKNEKKNNWK